MTDLDTLITDLRAKAEAVEHAIDMLGPTRRKLAKFHEAANPTAILTILDALTETCAEVAALREAQSPRPIETCPRDGHGFIAVDSRIDDWFQCVHYDDQDGLLHVADAEIAYQMGAFTHWIPAPALRKQETKDE